MTTIAEKTITELRRVFSTHDLPEQLVSNNRAQFTSEVFQQFLSIKHVRSALHHPSTNSEAKRFVQTFKNTMKAAKKNIGSFKTKLVRFLLVYRSTPNTTSGESPVELLFHRQIRTRHSLVFSTIANKQADQKS